MSKEFEYFLAHQEELYIQYPDQYLVITGDFVAAVKPTLDLAVLYVLSNGLKKGTSVFRGLGGSCQCNTYDLTMRIEQKLPPITIEVGAIDLDDEIDIFIGMDVISMGTMVVVGHENSLDFNFILDK